MPITLSEDTTRQMIASLRRYAADRLDFELDELPAALLLDFIVREFGPSIYNQGLSDAQTWITARVADMEGDCAVEEFVYWNEDVPGKIRRKRST